MYASKTLKHSNLKRSGMKTANKSKRKSIRSIKRGGSKLINNKLITSKRGGKWKISKKAKRSLAKRRKGIVGKRMSKLGRKFLTRKTGFRWKMFRKMSITKDVLDILKKDTESKYSKTYEYLLTMNKRNLNNLYEVYKNTSRPWSFDEKQPDKLEILEQEFIELWAQVIKRKVDQDTGEVMHPKEHSLLFREMSITADVLDALKRDIKTYGHLLYMNKRNLEKLRKVYKDVVGNIEAFTFDSYETPLDGNKVLKDKYKPYWIRVIKMAIDSNTGDVLPDVLDNAPLPMPSVNDSPQHIIPISSPQSAQSYGKFYREHVAPGQRRSSPPQTADNWMEEANRAMMKTPSSNKNY